MEEFVYKENRTKEISFPLGGIGSGCIGIAGNGRFRDIEIFNRPNKGSTNGYTHFAIKAEDDKGLVNAKVLNSDLMPGYVGQYDRPNFQGYGYGPDRSDLTGLPHFESSEFEGKFPISDIKFIDEQFPGDVKLTSFNPFIPTNEDDSSIPGAFFEIEITNSTDEELTYSVALSCNNYYGNKWGQQCIHKSFELDEMSGIYLSNTGDMNDLNYGDLSILTDCNDVSTQKYWYRGNMFDSLTTFWKDFTTFGSIKDRNYKENKVTHDFVNPCDDIATLVAKVKLKPSETKKVRFVMTWHKPQMTNDWEITATQLSKEHIANIRNESWKNYYGTLFATSKESGIYSMNNFNRLYETTKRFRDTLFASTLPQSAMDAVASNLSALKSPICLRLEDGTFYGFEGNHAHMGACDGTCTHVWSYAYALPFLFPRLERSARNLECSRSLDQYGGMDFRVQIPVTLATKMNFRPAVDGQYGTVMRVYREFMISGDIQWLKSVWEKVKLSIEYAWSDNNPDAWDPGKTGIITGRQHHTLDMELFGANAWLSGMYLGGLRAGAELAKILGEDKTYNDYMNVFERGKKTLNTSLFNGEYFVQDVDLNDKNLLEKFSAGLSIYNQSTVDEYWNEEQGEIKYQIGSGCSIDQVLGQWHADLIGLGEIFEKDKVGKAVDSIYRYNYKETMRDHFNPCRVYALNDESGTVICSFPREESKPFIPIPYSEESMTGFEYAAAAMMAKYDRTKESDTCVGAIRNRYDGERRNPWSEIECGSNYARSMASYSLLLIHSGFEYDMYHKHMGFKPIIAGDCKYFWSLDSGWGDVEFFEDEIHLNVLYGYIDLKSFSHNMDNITKLYLNGTKKAVINNEKLIVFEKVSRLNSNSANWNV